MRRNGTSNRLLAANLKVMMRLPSLVVFAVAFLLGCQNGPKKQHQDIGKIIVDDSLKALLAPSDEQVVGKAELVEAIYQSKIFTVEVQGMVNYDGRNKTSVASRVSGRLEKLYVKFNYQPVKKGQLLFEVYAPDLAAAQQELIYLSQSKGDEALLAKAKQRLLLLGVSEQTIQQVLRSKKVSYRVPVYSPVSGYILEQLQANNAQISNTTVDNASADGMLGMGSANNQVTNASTNVSTPNAAVLIKEGQYVNAGQSMFTIYRANDLLAEFTLNPALGGVIKKGDKLAFYKTANKENTFQTANIGLLEPIVRAGENFTVARVYIAKGSFKVGEILTAKIPVLLPKSYWLPTQAVLHNGSESIVFKKENKVFVPKTVSTGLSINEWVQIKQDIANWQVAKQAAYLVDSESFIKVKDEQ